MIENHHLFSTPNPNNPEYLVGKSRKRILMLLTETLNYTIETKTTSLVLLLGTYGSGKTHLLRYFAQEGGKEPVKLIQIYLQSTDRMSFSDILISLAHEAGLNDKIDLTRLGEVDSIRPVDEAVSIMQNLSREGFGFCIIIDEFERSWQDNRLIYQLRHLIDSSPPGLLVILSAAATEAEIGQIQGPLQARASQVLLLEPFSDEDASDLLQRCTAGETKFSDLAARLINSAAEGIPRKILGLAYSTLGLLEIRGKNIVTPSDVSRALSQEQIYKHFRYTRLFSLRQRMLSYLLLFDAALVALVGFYLISVAGQNFPIAIVVCVLLVAVLYPIERLILDIYTKQ